MEKNEEKMDLKKVLKSINAEAVLIVDNDGNMVDSLNIEYDTNVALMTETLFTMCKDLSKDIGNGELDQIMAKSSDGFFIANKLSSESIIISISKDISKIGLILKLMNSLKIK
ncbi:roadblock/LC7 domain-containing protein [Aquimarina algiphila]|uniref:roadblock/LC7 domain-containing protein n=1 Tax=Aquimarina algiphila TaxID=2047982 RepID=UPI00232E7F4E|nr:roadblock/LC7 domain-containing protein [Aquimarina algiphila]